MRVGARRQSWRTTSRDLHRLVSRAGRKWVQEFWQAANAVAQEGPPLSPLAVAVGAGIAETRGASGAPVAEEVHRARLAVVRTGYATRSVLVSPAEQPSPDQAWFGFSARLDPELAATDFAVVRELVDKVRTISETDFHSVMTLPEDAWSAYVVIATRELQRTLVSGSISYRELSRERIDELLRCGYLVACLDEAVEWAGTARHDVP